MDVKYKQIVDFGNYFGNSKPSGDAAIDLRIASIEIVSHQGEMWRCVDATASPVLHKVEPKSESGYVLNPNSVYFVHTGICVAVPENHVGLLSLRSSAGRSGFCMLNSPGIIDYGYTGELMLSIITVLGSSVIVPQWYRLAQLTIVECSKIRLVQESDLGNTERGDKGFGSTGAI